MDNAARVVVGTTVLKEANILAFTFVLQCLGKSGVNFYVCVQNWLSNDR